MEQVFDEIDSLMDDRLMSKKSSGGMGCGFEGSQDDKDFTVNEAEEKQFPYDPEGVEALEFSDSDLEAYASQTLEVEAEEPPAPEVGAL